MKAIKTIKKVAMALAMILAVSVIAPAANVSTPFTDEVQAATATYNVFKGEKFTYTVYGGKIKSVSFSKTGILSVKKDSSTKRTFTAKKAGTTKVTIKFTNGKSKVFNVNVSNPSTVKVSVVRYDESSNYLFIKVKNDSKVSLDWAKFDYTLKDSDGIEFCSDTTSSVYDLPVGTTAYTSVYCSGGVPDLSKCKFSFNVKDSYHSFSYKYTKVSSKYYKLTTKALDDGKTRLTLKNLTKQNINAVVEARYYDEAGNLIYVRPTSFYIKAKKTDSYELSDMSYLNYAKVTYSVRAYYKTYID